MMSGSSQGSCFAGRGGRFSVPPMSAEYRIFLLSLELSAPLLRAAEHEIVTGGPADLGGELHPADRIVGVAQGDEPFVDVIGWRVDDVVQLVRGAKGTVVRLNVLPEGSTIETKTISITTKPSRAPAISATCGVLRVPCVIESWAGK